MEEINIAIANELAIVSQKLEESKKTLTWLLNFVQDQTVKNVVESTLDKIK